MMATDLKETMPTGNRGFDRWRRILTATDELTGGPGNAIECVGFCHHSIGRSMSFRGFPHLMFISYLGLVKLARVVFTIAAG
jgi:hypothetical protein